MIHHETERAIELQALRKKVADLEKDVARLQAHAWDCEDHCKYWKRKYEQAVARRASAKNTENQTPGFDAFWAAWPSNHRKVNKKKCLQKWIADDLEIRANEVVAHVQACILGADWNKDGGQFIPAPLVYLNQERYLAAPPPPVAVKSVGSLAGIQYKTDGVDDDGFFN